MRPRELDASTVKRLEGEAGYLGTAAEMIGCSPEYRDIVSNLLGRTVIAETIDHAIAISRKFRYAFRVVTIDGEILNPGGSMTGGSQPSKSSSLLSRNRIIRELDEKLEQLSLHQEKLESDCKKQADNLSEMEEKLRVLQKELQDQELTVMREEHRVLGIQDNIESFAAKQEMLQAEKNELEDNIKASEQEIEEEGRKLSSIEENIVSLKATIEAHQLKSKEEQAKRDAIHMDINDYKVSVNSIHESMEQTNEAIEHLSEEKTLLAQTIQKRIEDKVKNQERMETLQSEIIAIGEKFRAEMR